MDSSDAAKKLEIAEGHKTKGNEYFKGKLISPSKLNRTLYRVKIRGSLRCLRQSHRNGR